MTPYVIKYDVKSEKKTIMAKTIIQYLNVYLRNEFDFWKVHGIMNTSGVLQSK